MTSSIFHSIKCLSRFSIISSNFRPCKVCVVILQLCHGRLFVQFREKWSVKLFSKSLSCVQRWHHAVFKQQSRERERERFVQLRMSCNIFRLISTTSFIISQTVFKFIPSRSHIVLWNTSRSCRRHEFYADNVFVFWFKLWLLVD